MHRQGYHWQNESIEYGLAMYFNRLAVVLTAIAGHVLPVGASVWNSRFLHQSVIDYVVDCMGDEIYDVSFLSGRRTRTRFHACAKEAKATILPRANLGNLKEWVKHYVLHGESKTDTAERLRILKAKYPEEYRDIGRQGDWSAHDTHTLKSIVEENPDAYLDEIQKEMVFAGRKCYSLSYIWKQLTGNAIKYSLKRAIEIAAERDEEERARYLESREIGLARPEMAVFIDETFKGKNDGRRKRRWGRKGKKASYRRPLTFTGSHDRRYSMLAAADVNGFVFEACEIVYAKTSSTDNDPTRGTIDAERFELWVEEFLCPTLGNYALQEPRSLVILDNASTHHTARVRELIRATGAEILYTAPYSPDLNPIEEMFAKYKMMLRRHQNLSLEDAHVAALLSVTPSDARGYYRNAKVPGCEMEEEVEEAAAAFNTQVNAAVSSVVAALGTAHSLGLF